MRSVILTVLLTLAGATAGYLATATTADRSMVPDVIVAGQPEPPPTPARSVATLLHRHRCWSDDAPPRWRGRLPGHVVLTRRHHVVYGGQRLVGLALEQIFDGKNHGLVVHGFCP